jgi:DNA polymerase III subunit epsilon
MTVDPATAPIPTAPSSPEAPVEARRLIVCDTETTGLDSTRNDVVEIAYVVVGPYLPGLPSADLFVPPHTTDNADPEALTIDVMYERTRRLHRVLASNTLAGANPSFDARFLSALFLRAGLDPEPWHHRLGDLSAYCAGVLGIDPTNLPGARQVAEFLGVVNDRPHTAAGDVITAARCFDRLRAIVAARPPLDLSAVLGIPGVGAQ